MVELGSLKWILGWMRKSLELWGNKDTDCCKQRLPGHSRGEVYKTRVWRDTDDEDLAREVSEGNRDSHQEGRTDHLCCLPTKNLAECCLRLKKKTQAKLKNNGLVPSAEEISGQQSIQTMEQLLPTPLSRLTEKEQQVECVGW